MVRCDYSLADGGNDGVVVVLGKKSQVTGFE